MYSHSAGGDKGEEEEACGRDERFGRGEEIGASRERGLGRAPKGLRLHNRFVRESAFVGLLSPCLRSRLDAEDGRNKARED